MDKNEKLKGKLVEITDKTSDYYGHWGYIKDWDGDNFHITGGSIALNHGGITPIFDRDQFRVRKAKYQKYCQNIRT